MKEMLRAGPQGPDVQSVSFGSRMENPPGNCKLSVICGPVNLGGLFLQ